MLNPNREGRKYLNFAQMLTSFESLQMYNKGVQVLETDAESYKKGLRHEDSALATKQIATAYASLADLYMTDLCDEPNAEAKCEESLQKALEKEPDNMDALQSLGNLRMVRNKDGEAKVHLGKVYQKMMRLKENESAIGNIEANASQKVEHLPSIDFRMQTARLLVELEEFKKGVKILDTIITEEDEHVETWYLLGFCFCKLQKHANG